MAAKYLAEKKTLEYLTISCIKLPVDVFFQENSKNGIGYMDIL
jgi:hypothetical protein